MSGRSQAHQDQLSGDNEATQPNGQQSFMLQEYLRADATVSERCSGVMGGGKDLKGKKTRKEQAAEEIKKFDDKWEKK
ncbi:hypothetical protein F5X99DRAFT_339730 [Biscogniauxia marginata]|nr:hypothetical protein F5X99DRAFT_339730 [Biscogniauxia marginata]